jgi:glucose-1-phosphate thymidylyltransferase
VKGVILAGGTGSRLSPLTLVTNKHLLPVYNKPMIYYPINTLLRAGIKRIIIVTGRENGGSFMNLLGSGADFGAHFQYALQDRAGGIAEALSLAEDFVHSESMFVILGDNIVIDDLSQDVRSFRNGAKVFLKEVPEPQRFGVPVLDGDIITKIEEKPVKPKSRYAITGVYFYDHTVFDKIRTLKPSTRGELEVTDLNNLYIRDRQLSYAILKHPWLDAGTFDSLLQASNMVKEMNLHLVFENPR